MNAVEIETAVSELVNGEYDPVEFPFQFLAAFDKKDATLKRLRKGDTNKTDVPGAVLLINNIHMATCPTGQTKEMIFRLKASPKTLSSRAKFIFATDGTYFEAEDVTGAQEPVADSLPNLANHFGFFLPLAGITTVREIKDNPIDVRATGRLNKLYLELLRINPEWGTAGRRHAMNHFMARLIFCFFAEHTDIFDGYRLFTDTVEQMSAGDGSNAHLVLEQVFRAMDIKDAHRADSDVPLYASRFPYVNGGLFRDSSQTPIFNRIARSFLIQAGKLEWQHITPDIFGSMIQAVADEEERGALGMHYTSVPNILKVLNPLFLDDLRTQLETAGDNGRMLLKLRQRMSRIRIFDPACGSGNFLVIAYKQMRSIEAEINRRRGEAMRPSEISKKNFRGIELRDFAAEIARLALVIAEYQCDVSHRGQLAAKAKFLPLDEMNWITSGNALLLDWLQVCPPEGTSVKMHTDDLFQTPLDQPEIDFENEGGETFICGNPPYLGSQDQSPEQKADLAAAFGSAIKSTKSADYVSGWFIKGRNYLAVNGGSFAYVTTNSVCQGRQVALLWPAILGREFEIRFAAPSFTWSNLASKKAAVTVSIIGVGPRSNVPKLLIDGGQAKQAKFIGPYLVPDQDTVVSSVRSPLSGLTPMTNGSMPNDDGGLLLTVQEYQSLVTLRPEAARFCRRFLGSHDSIQGHLRYCLWIEDADLDEALQIPEIVDRIAKVKKHRGDSDRAETNSLASISHSFGERRHQGGRALLIPRHSSEARPYLPSVFVSDDTVIGDSAIALYGLQMVDFSIYSSRMHLVWVATVCGKIKEDYRYSNTLGWNTFPVPSLTEQNRKDLTVCAENILLARETHFPATLAYLYDPEKMPENLRAAHDANDEVLERIYIGRRFRNDTDRLEKLFEMYTRLLVAPAARAASSIKRTRRAKA